MGQTAGSMEHCCAAEQQPEKRECQVGLRHVAAAYLPELATLLFLLFKIYVMVTVLVKLIPTAVGFE